MPVEFDPAAILEVLRRHGVDCVVIGGFGAFLHGSPLITEDVDVVPRVDHDNYARLSVALFELEAKVRAQGADPLPFDHDADSLAAVMRWNLTTKYGDLDVTVRPSGTDGYDDLRRDAITVQLHDKSVVIASLADIVRSKEAAGRDKDRRMLPVLRELVARETRARAQARRRNR